MYGRTRLLAVGCCLVVMFLGCTDPTGDGPTGPEFAKGGNKGKPGGGGGGDPVLQEFWVIPGDTESDDEIHVEEDPAFQRRSDLIIRGVRVVA